MACSECLDEKQNWFRTKRKLRGKGAKVLKLAQDYSLDVLDSRDL